LRGEAFLAYCATRLDAAFGLARKSLEEVFEVAARPFEGGPPGRLRASVRSVAVREGVFLNDHGDFEFVRKMKRNRRILEKKN
jgi:hypothetical protein